MLRRSIARAPARLLGARHLSSAAADAVAPYRAMAQATAAQRGEWAKADEVLHARMREHVPAALKHNGEEAFDDHLIGVQSVLRSWGAPETLCNAALFHSIYGTEGFQGYKLPLSHRAEVRPWAAAAGHPHPFLTYHGSYKHEHPSLPHVAGRNGPKLPDHVPF